MIYTGIGSRETPEHMEKLFMKIAKRLAELDYTLRSGGADGADSAFEEGCSSANGRKEIYLPWKGFNGSTSELVVTPDAFTIASKFHPAWDKLSQGAKKLHARNVHQILGYNLDSPTDFVLCWTKNGSGSGGTGQAIRIAKNYNIPVIDAGGYNNSSLFITEIKNTLRR